MKEKIRIIVEFNGDYARSRVDNVLPHIQQAMICHNPLDEPFVYLEVSRDNGITWKKENIMVNR